MASLGISFSLGNFTLSPGSLQKETGAWRTVTGPGQRPDDGDSTAQVPQALRPLTGEMRGGSHWEVERQSQARPEGGWSLCGKVF